MAVRTVGAEADPCCQCIGRSTSAADLWTAIHSIQWNGPPRATMTLLTPDPCLQFLRPLLHQTPAALRAAKWVMPAFSLGVMVPFTPVRWGLFKVQRDLHGIAALSVLTQAAVRCASERFAQAADRWVTCGACDLHTVACN